jgi:GTPase SAR1 family protein
MAKKGIKLGVVAMEASGKTTLISKLKNSLVVSTDNKAFTENVPHFRYSTYNGLEDLTFTIEEKYHTYQERFGKLPNTIVVDSVTHLTNNMEKYCNDKYSGFSVYSNLGKDVLAFNSFLEEIIAEGINVVFTAHCQYDRDTMKYKIHSPGNFGKNGSWVSVTDNAIFIEIKDNKRVIHHKTIKFPCRSNVEDLEEFVAIEDYDINKHIELLENQITESEEWAL